MALLHRAQAAATRSDDFRLLVVVLEDSASIVVPVDGIDGPGPMAKTAASNVGSQGWLVQVLIRVGRRSQHFKLQIGVGFDLLILPALTYYGSCFGHKHRSSRRGTGRYTTLLIVCLRDRVCSTVEPRKRAVTRTADGKSRSRGRSSQSGRGPSWLDLSGLAKAQQLVPIPRVDIQLQPTFASLSSRISTMSISY